jgi:N-acetylmuramoyl-L-alanine amidase
LGAQEELRVQRSSGGPTVGIRLATTQGFAAFSAQALVGLGWQIEDLGDGIRATFAGGEPVAELSPGSPFFRWGNETIQLAEAPYRQEGHLQIPVQFLVDVLPWKLPDFFRYEPGSLVLQVLDSDGSSQPGASSPSPPALDPTRVVVIDAGHGGQDPGTRGPGGTREKDVVLGIAEDLAQILRGVDNLEVYMTRDSDVLVPIWQRGELATDWKGDRPGIFISIHANAVPNSQSTRGFETYFLSEARTEHERRVAALENAAMEYEEEADQPEAGNPDLSFILTELRNLDYTHWSSVLAETVQEDLAKVHPGPNRGVKQGPLAVITNSLMPAVLVEVGFLSNREEERLLLRKSFQEDLAQAIARAVVDFFHRYPPGEEWEDGG